jgi:hypothetical protein
MDTGAPLQVPQQMPTNFSSAQSITMNPLLNYGQPQIEQAGGTPLSMNRGGIARLGYQMGGEAMMQPQMGGEMSMPQMNEQQALETIIQLLIEQGVDPETALKLAAQILQIFAQGGEPAVEAFANQLEQQEQVQEMAGGGIAGLYPRQGYFVGKIVKSVGKAVSGVVKGVASAVKSVAKSPIGRIALTIGANMLLPGAGSAFAAALQSAAVNLGIQAIAGGKINPMEALLAGAGGYFNYTPSGVTGADTALKTGQTVTTDGATNITANLADKGIGNPTLDTTGFGTDYGPTAGLRTAAPVNDITGARSDLFTLDRATLDPAAGKGSQIYNPPTNVEAKPGFFQDTLNKAQTGIQNLYKDPIGTIKGIGTAALDYTQKEPGTALALAAGAGSLATLGAQLGVPRNEGEDDDSYAKRLEGVQGYITQYGKNLSIRDPYFYQREGAVNPFAPTMAANGGIMGYRKGGSMIPPARQIEGGIIELDARKTGGYIPYGKKERVDDVPAMLAKDEFVFTSRAVKAAGGGSAKRGAAKMYALMKQLESKGARA